jgi:hypothetical protein
MQFAFYTAVMRALFTSLIASSVVLIHVLDNPGRLSNGLESAKQRAIAFLNTKEIRIEGLHAIPRAEIERSLPLTRSVGWWMLNETSIKSRVAENPWVKSVELEPCRGSWVPKFGCFTLTIEERKPRFIALVDEERWIIGADGALITPAKGDAPGMSDEMLRSLVPLYGLASRVSSPDRSQAQLELAQKAITVLERSVELPVESISFEGKGDISVDFDRLPFPVVFGSTSSDASVVIEDQGRRLKALLVQLKDRLPEIQKVDLAFSKVGVVKFKAPPAQEN